MYSYALLENGCYYLIQEQRDKPVSLIRINVESDHCVFISRFLEQEIMEWKRKTDPIYDIIELLGDETVAAWDQCYNTKYDLEQDDESD